MKGSLVQIYSVGMLHIPIPNGCVTHHDMGRAVIRNGL